MIKVLVSPKIVVWIVRRLLPSQAFRAGCVCLFCRAFSVLLYSLRADMIPYFVFGCISYLRSSAKNMWSTL